MIGFIIGLIIFIIGSFMAIFSLIAKMIKKDYSSKNYLFWVIILTLGTLICQVSAIYI